jgi:hypothetical protein
MTVQSKTQYEIKVYRLWYEDAPDEFYIGSTKEDALYKRMRTHRNSGKRGGKSKLYQLIRSKGVGFKYSQIASCMVSCKDEQRAFEQSWIDKLHPTLNNNRAYGLDIERYKHKQKEYQQSPEYKQKIKEYYQSPERKQMKKEYNRSKKRTCVCGCEYIANPSNAQIHYNSDWHQDFIEGLPYPLNGGK